jgi:hypothetical protein
MQVIGWARRCRRRKRRRVDWEGTIMVCFSPRLLDLDFLKPGHGQVPTLKITSIYLCDHDRPDHHPTYL